MKFRIVVDIELSNGLSQDIAEPTLNNLVKVFKELVLESWLQPLNTSASLIVVEKRTHE